ncbi:YgiQ family radical SAM protein [Oxalobacter formigenes]|nr:YgiQ family radical SAM protein [Oxalobacter formigenes]MCZ4061971.1 YgiQ family radical SAM protein [Oxalobacter formigenes]WAW02561.1 YgiQ family radical SAM protein [Oxalobacter formigenes]WAW04746.1 YgiQ family radical SAM protein [Oxalobacter formigenes]WAW05053.1 YgiQ family radical SAM protein [Oxalobacter formigenes]WAW08863.1 YgiQ family radical SAM protein [Oxalobacter formigenes]
MSKKEMDALGWDACDIILVSGDAYIDHPSFGVALIGRVLEAQGFRVGIIAQPDWKSAQPFRALGKPKLYFGVTSGNMDSMVNRYTAERKIRSDDAYTPGGKAGKRPDRALVVYAQRAKEAYPGIPVVIGSIEASLRRVAHYDYWSDKVRRSVLPDSKADILVYGNAERAIVDLSHRLAAGEKIESIRDLRGTAYMVPKGWKPAEDWVEVDSSSLDKPGPVKKHANPYFPEQEVCGAKAQQDKAAGESIRESKISLRLKANSQSVVRLPSYEQVVDDPVLYAHASRVMHLESNPGNARALVQAHGERDVWLNPPPLPLAMEEMDGVFGLPYARGPHPAYKGEAIPAWEMIRFSVNIMRGCFGGCSFCSITEHEGRIIQSRSEPSVLREIEEIRDNVDGFTGVISDLGGPTANMYRLGCRDEKIQSVCRRLSCVYPQICKNLNTDHSKLISLYRKARALPGVKKILIGSGVRYDIAVKSPEYIRELVTHHVGGLLKIAPEHTEQNVLSKMMKPGIGTYDEFKRLFDRYSKEAGKEQYLVPYFIAAHPGATDEDMLNLALWLKRNRFRPDQVQTFMPTPLALATTMYHSERNPLEPVSYDSEKVETARKGQVRRLHKAFLRYHDPENWQLLREWLRRHGRDDLIGNGPNQLVPAWKSAPAGAQNRFATPAKKGNAVKSGLQGQPKNRTANKTERPKQGDSRKGQFAAASRHRKGVPTRSGR